MCGTLNTNQRSPASSLIITSPDRTLEADINNQEDMFKDYILGKNSNTQINIG